MRRLQMVSGLLTIGLWASVTQADVVRASELGFTVTQSVNVPMPPTAAWSALSDVGRWWDSEHTYSGDARNMSLTPIAGECFCEKYGMYNSIRHMTVTAAMPPKLLRLSGALGPLQEFAVTGSLTWNIEAAGGGSKITMTYIAGGYADRSMAEWAPLVDSVLAIQVKRLGRYISTGNPADAK